MRIFNAAEHHDSVSDLYDNHHTWLRGWLRKKVGCHDAAADLVHDTFLNLLAAREPLATMKEPRAFLSTMAKRLLIDRVRHQHIEETYLAELMLIADTLPNYPSPEAILVAVQALQQFYDALNSLPAKAADAFLLHYMQDKSQQEVAEHIGVSVRMVQKYLSQALLRCHAVFGD